MVRRAAWRNGVAVAIAFALAGGALGQAVADSASASVAAAVNYVPAMTFDVASVRESKADLATGIMMT
jgi:hypothetical protein